MNQQWKQVAIVVLAGVLSAGTILADEAAIHWGPVLGYADTNLFTVRLRLETEAAVTMNVDNRTLSSPSGLYHAFTVEHVKPGAEYAYTLTASSDAKTNRVYGPFTGRTYAQSNDLTFIAIGDSRTNPDIWARASKAVARAEPAFCVFGGDMTMNGTLDTLWDREFFGPGQELLQNVPFYAIMGNHENNSPVFLKMFATPGGELNWSQQIGPVLLIGLNDFSAEPAIVSWLEGILGKTGAKFIFLFAHYPAWSSGPHGKMKDGHPAERTSRIMREQVMPLLAKYKATAAIVGHDHLYERSEPDCGVTHIIAGGAGAPLYMHPVEDAKQQNPYSKVLASVFHYCVLTVKGDTCTLQTLHLDDNKVIDTREWKARTVRAE